MYYIILYYVILYYTIFYYTTLYYSILILYYIILYCIVLYYCKRCARPPVTIGCRVLDARRALDEAPEKFPEISGVSRGFCKHLIKKRETSAVFGDFSANLVSEGGPQRKDENRVTPKPLSDDIGNQSLSVCLSVCLVFI